MSLAQLLLRFFIIGLFTIGGGLMAIPLIHELVIAYDFLSESEFLSMVAIAQSTPGPVGVNVATFVGIAQQGVWGGILATFAFVLPSVIIITTIVKFSAHVLEHPTVLRAFQGIRPAVAGLIAGITISLGYNAFKNIFADQDLFTALIGVGLFTLILLLRFSTKLAPALLIVFAGTVGGLLL